MRGNHKGRKAKKVAPNVSRSNRDWLPTVDRRSQLDSTSHIYYYGRGTWRYRNYISIEEFTHRLAIIFVSAGTFGIGLGQLIYQIFGH